jgi:hypothetical protein
MPERANPAAETDKAKAAKAAVPMTIVDVRLGYSSVKAPTLDVISVTFITKLVTLGSIVLPTVMLKSCIALS